MNAGREQFGAEGGIHEQRETNLNERCVGKKAAVSWRSWAVRSEEEKKLRSAQLRGSVESFLFRKGARTYGKGGRSQGHLGNQEKEGVARKEDKESGAI